MLSQFLDGLDQRGFGYGLLSINIKHMSKKEQKMKVIYEQVESPDQTAINKAYDILFEEVLRIRRAKKSKDKKEGT
jgi:hypothetical protein